MTCREVSLCAELVFPCILQLLVELAGLRFCTHALAAFLMKLGFYLCNASLQFGKLFQYIVVDALKLLDSQFHGTLVKVEFVGLVHQIMDISVFTAVPLKWASRSLKQLKHSLLEEVFHVRRFESVILQPINGLLYEQRQICVRTIG